MRRWLGHAGAYAVVGLMWLLHWLPLALLAPLGRGLGRLLWWVGRSRRHVALTNLRLCFPHKTEAERVALARDHFGWLGRSLLERSLMWFASPARLKRIIHVEGDVGWADRTGAPVMWLMPHFVGLEFCAPALMLFQGRAAVDVYQRQSNPVFDAWLNRGRQRFDPARSILIDRALGVRPVMRAIQNGAGFVNGADMDFGIKDSAFIPFFGVPACTLLAPGRMARTLGLQVQPVVVTLLPGGQGWRVRFMPAPEGFPDADAQAGARALHRWLEALIEETPAQYFWVHRRFKTRPEGEPPVY
ncbi:Lauroyl/myristoyl acyltransferase [Burkholderiales bacterium JOSHI_001]|nr:Lauroyl/myristoyl acyltransferase [Burkholderiales bacterium JOSHI_001]